MPEQYKTTDISRFSSLTAHARQHCPMFNIKFAVPDFPR